MRDSSSVERAIAIVGSGAESLLPAAREAAETLGVALEEISLGELREQGVERVPEGTRIVALIGDAEIGEIVTLARLRSATLGLVPSDDGARIATLARLPRPVDERLAVAFAAEVESIDVLFCNGEPALGLVTIGEIPFLERRGDDRGPVTTLRRLRVALRSLVAIRPFPVRVQVGDAKAQATAIVGAVVIENDVDHPAAKLLDSAVSVQDGRTTAVLIAPTSIVGYVALLATTLAHRVRAVRRLPRAIAWTQASRLVFEAEREIPYRVDARSRRATSIELRLEPGALGLATSAAYRERHARDETGKDVVRLANLPTGEDRLALIRGRLPLFPRAAEDEFKDLFRLLREGATLGPDYLALIVLSAMVATLGMFLSSAAVIIGAMVLAPLMSPIISLSMGVLRASSDLERRSLVAIAVGVAIALVVSALLALVIPLERVTPEMEARLRPSLLDLGVAVFSGVAGAYAHARENVLKSLPGVAIAVALMPPLCVAGIGLGWLDGTVFLGAMLLFVTNLVGIALAASTTFLVLGFAPVRSATRGLGIGLAALAVVAVPLSISFRDIWEIYSLERQVREAPVPVGGRSLTLRSVRVTLERPAVRVRGVVASDRALDRETALAVKAALEQRLSRPVRLELETRLVP